MSGDAIEHVLKIHRGFLPDFSAEGFEIGSGLLKLGVDGGTFLGGEIEVGGDEGLNVGRGTIHGRVFTAGMSDGMLGDASHHQQAAADATGGAEDENEREKQKRLPA